MNNKMYRVVCVALAVVLATMLQGTCVFAENSINVKFNPASSNVAVYGQLADDTYTVGENVTVYLHKADTEITTANAADNIAYIGNTTVNSDGSYRCKFKLTKPSPEGFTAKIRVGDTVINRDITIASENIYTADISLTDENDGPLNLIYDRVGKAKANVVNMLADNMKLTMLIAYYDAENRVIACSNPTETNFGYFEDTGEVRLDVPQNAEKAKCFLWENIATMIPVANPKENNKADYDKETHIFLVGDSNGQSYSNVLGQGWGYYYPDYFDSMNTMEEKTTVDGQRTYDTENGKVFIYSKCVAGWATEHFLRYSPYSNTNAPFWKISRSIEQIKAENPNAECYVIMCIGGNDNSGFASGQTIPSENYKKNMQMFIDGYDVKTYQTDADIIPADFDTHIKGTREIGANLVIITPSVSLFNLTDNSESGYRRIYRNQLMELISENAADGYKITFLDSFSVMYNHYYNELGTDEARKRYVKSAAYLESIGGVWDETNETYVYTDPDTQLPGTQKVDLLHLNRTGARYVAKTHLKLLAQSDSNLKYMINDGLFTE